jgi:hypothetical protein
MYHFPNALCLPSVSCSFTIRVRKLKVHIELCLENLSGRDKLENIIVIYLNVIGREEVDWIKLALDRV